MYVCICSKWPHICCPSVSLAFCFLCFSSRTSHLHLYLSTFMFNFICSSTRPEMTHLTYKTKPKTHTHTIEQGLCDYVRDYVGGGVKSKKKKRRGMKGEGHAGRKKERKDGRKQARNGDKHGKLSISTANYSFEFEHVPLALSLTPNLPQRVGPPPSEM